VTVLFEAVMLVTTGFLVMPLVTAVLLVMLFVAAMFLQSVVLGVILVGFLAMLLGVLGLSIKEADVSRELLLL